MTNEQFKLEHPFGSSQYDGAYAAYQALLEARKSSATLVEAALKVGLKLTYGAIRPLEEAKKTLMEDIFPEEHASKRDEEDYDDLREIARADDAEGLFLALRNCGWDLWSAAPAILEAFVEDIDAEEVEGAPTHEEEAAGWPLINNMIINNESNSTGFACAILIDLGIVKDASCFEDFST